MSTIQRIRRVDSVMAAGKSGGSNAGDAARGSAGARFGAGSFSGSARVAMTLRASGVAATEALRRGQRISLGKKNTALAAADHRPGGFFIIHLSFLGAARVPRLRHIDEPQHEQNHEDDDDPENNLAH